MVDDCNYGEDSVRSLHKLVRDHILFQLYIIISAFDSELDTYAIGRSVPSGILCESTAPIQ